MHSSIIPKPHQPYWHSYVYYLVLKCECGNTYYHPATRNIELEKWTPQKMLDELQQIPHKVDSVCNQCGKRATVKSVYRGVLGYGAPDHSGSLLCDFKVKEGNIDELRVRFDATPNPIDYFRQHPAYFKTHPPDGSPSFIDDILYQEELGRVLSARSAWNEILHEALEDGASFLKAQEGYYLFATTSTDPSEVEQQLQSIADESFWNYLQTEHVPKRRLIGIDKWTPEQKKEAGLESGTYHEWLEPELAEALQSGKLHAVAYSVDSIFMQYFVDAAVHYGAEIDEVIPPEGGPSQLWMRTSSGVSHLFPPLDLLQLIAIYKGLLLSDLIWKIVERIYQMLTEEEKVFQRLSGRLPPGFSATWTTEPGKLLISHKDNPYELLTFAKISEQIDPNDEEAFSRLVSWIVSERTCECNRYVGKRLMSKTKFQEWSGELMQDPKAILYREKADDLIEIYTDECQHHVFYGLKAVNGDISKAEELFQRDLNSQHFKLRYYMKRNLLRRVQMIAFMGQDAASIATHPALLKGLLDTLKIKLGDMVRIFAPFNGVLAVSSMKVDEKDLEKFAYEAARALPEEPELKDDHLAYHDELILSDQKPLGHFSLEAYKPPTSSGRL